MNGIGSGVNPLALDDIVDKGTLLSIYQDDQDPHRAWNKVQLAASLRLIHHFFGDDWYRLVMGRVDSSGAMDDPKYRKYLRIDDPTRHPLNESLWSGQPAELVKIVRLGVALKVLGLDHPASDIDVKLPELRSASFSKAYFELKVAATYATSKFRVRFLRPEEGKRTPDILVGDSSGGEVPIECKKRDPVSTTGLEARANGVLDRIREANTQLKAFGVAGIIWVEVDDGLDFDDPEVAAYTEYVVSETPRITSAQCIVLSWEKLVETGDTTHLITGARGIPNDHVNPTVQREIWCNPDEIGKGFPPSVIDVPGGPPLLRHQL